MINYTIDPAVLKPFLPCRTELDSFNGNHYVSLVGFLFDNTRLLGIPIPLHRSFEEVNLRFYVRYKEAAQWKRGVVFVKEIVPRSAITLVANTFYGENYATHSMRHSWEMTDEGFAVSYEWRVGSNWNYLRALAEKTPFAIPAGSEEEFITEHYWGYTFVNANCSGTYEVLHPRWRVHKVKSHAVNCSVETLYGPGFSEALKQEPTSVFLAEGSPVSVMKGTKIFANLSS